jgi:beta-N-acetylhexosaminidase
MESDLIPVRTGIILDHNGHPVPDNTPVNFTLIQGGTQTSSQTANTQAGIARTSFLVEVSGALEIRADSDPAMTSTVIQFDIPPGEVLITQAVTTIPTTESPTPEPLPTSIPALEPTVTPPARNSPDLIDWFLAVLVAAMAGAAIYWIWCWSVLVEARRHVVIGGLALYLLPWIAGVFSSQDTGTGGRDRQRSRSRSGLGSYNKLAEDQGAQRIATGIMSPANSTRSLPPISPPEYFP